MTDNFPDWFSNLKSVAWQEYGYDPGSLYFDAESIPIWEPYFYTGSTEREAIEQELGE